MLALAPLLKARKLNTSAQCFDSVNNHIDQKQSVSCSMASYIVGEAAGGSSMYIPLSAKSSTHLLSSTSTGIPAHTISNSRLFTPDEIILTVKVASSFPDYMTRWDPP